MAKANQGNGKINKSEEIRQMIAQNPTAKTREIITLLGAKRIKVLPSQVYFIMSKRRRNKLRQKRERVAATSQGTGSTNPVQLVLKVKSLALDAGGIKHLKQLVDVLAE